jgi:hypothetical protein
MMTTTTTTTRKKKKKTKATPDPASTRHSGPRT